MYIHTHSLTHRTTIVTPAHVQRVKNLTKSPLHCIWYRYTYMYNAIQTNSSRVYHVFSYPHHGDFIEPSSKGCKWLRGQWATSPKEHDTRFLLLLSQNYGTNQLPCSLRWITLHTTGRGERREGGEKGEEEGGRKGWRERERERIHIQKQP